MKANSAFQHRHIVAGTVAKLQEVIEAEQRVGYELVSIVKEDGGHWHAFMKCGQANFLENISCMLGDVRDNVKSAVQSLGNRR